MRYSKALRTADKLLRTADKLPRTADKLLRTADKFLRIAGALIVLAALIPRTARAQEPIPGWVGVAYTTMGEADRDGNLVFRDYPVIESVDPNSPAQKAGLEAGDMILAMNAQDLKAAPLPVASMIQPGRRILFRFKRGDVVRDAMVIVAPRPRGTSGTLVVTMIGTPGRAPSPPGTPVATREPSAPRQQTVTVEIPPLAPVLQMMPRAGPRSLAIAGAELTRLNAGLRQLVGVNSPGIFVVNVGQGSPANVSGLRPGDVIIKAESFTLGDPGDLLQVLSEANRSIRLQIVRNKKPQTIVLRW